jgi:hypothetical protein
MARPIRPRRGHGFPSATTWRTGAYPAIVIRQLFTQFTNTLVCTCVLLASVSWGSVLVRWSDVSVPPPTALGVRDIVIVWSDNASAVIRQAKQAGFGVYTQIGVQDAISVAQQASKEPIAGIIVDPANAVQSGLDGIVNELRARYPKLSIRVLDPNGKQPLMRGQTITTSNGVLQVSSPTAQPWLDSNLPLARFDEEFHPEQVPLYTFEWQPGDSLQQANGVSADDYCLAIAEASAIHADLVLNLDPYLQKGLVHKQSAASASWSKVTACLAFASAVPESLRPWANVGVLTSDYDSAYEPMNLMGRHNIPYRVLRLGKLDAEALRALDVLAVFAAPANQDANAINSFVQNGGTAVLVEIHGTFPWQSVAPVKTAERALSYAVGKGHVIELSEPVSDPETFAQDVRRLIPQDHVLISAWNALTTLSIPYLDTNTGDVVVQLVNYAQDRLRIQIRVKGSFSSVRYQTPDQKCCLPLTPIQRGGFTEFVVPSLRIAGRLQLTPNTQKDSKSPSR